MTVSARTLLALCLLPLSTTAYAADILLEANSSSTNNCIPFGQNYGNNTTNPSYMGFIYQNVDPFELSPGDTIAFDLYQPNDQTIIHDIALATTTSNGSSEQDGAGFTTVVHAGTPADPDGDSTQGNYELAFTADTAFSFGGGGLIIRFQAQGSFVNDSTCTQVLVWGSAGDSSGYFVRRFYNDTDGVYPWDGSGTTSIGNVLITWTDQFCADADGDGYGDPNTCVTGSQPTGYVPNDDDCDDSDSDTFPGAAPNDSSTDCMTDADGDDYGDDSPASGVTSGTDCDDSVASINPAATEVCDSVDNDCDTLVDDDDPSLDTSTQSTFYADADVDGFGDATSSTLACSQPAGYVSDSTDCDDSSASVYPGATEYCNGYDDDCDGDTDEDSAADASTWYADDDGDSYGDASDSDVDCDQPSGYVSDSTDCDDTNASVNPAADEYCSTAYDDDCDGVVNEDDAVDTSTFYADADGDSYGDASVTDAACTAGTGYVSDSTDCDDTSASVYPGATEYCNGVDDDCDSDTDEDDAVDVATWYADADGDSYGDASVTDIDCDQPSGYVASSTDCDDASASVYPGADEYCNGVDDDCDSDTDEDDAVDASTWYYDGDADGYGDASVSDVDCDQPTDYVSDSTDCDDADADSYPLAPETPYDGVDQDCDGFDLCDVDEDGFDHPDCEGDDCDDENDTVYPGAPEIPDGLDNDCNGIAEDDDTDGDGLPDEYENDIGTDPNNPDSDGDGLLDGQEATPGQDAPDTDGDGLIDPLDDDDDDDGILTEVEAADGIPVDTDGDGTPDHLDEDSDGDGALDIDEGVEDIDCDGIVNYVDADDDDGACDSGVVVDDTGGDGGDKGCNCASSSAPAGSAGLLLGLLALVGLRRRRA
ncbi:MAG: hypothetical protein H6739_09420 [Alphaproteobacteria bacterium]|nr:hypothetical protein [Alphaproteobacteria bacterium]